ncbi:MAG: nucleotidyltransferase family protein [Armatimonadetes bacterium]|nr:nucleotidyltransferase family protein [Armatimonadota bacterium]MDE2205625.1 nucleotidyltransferase family protein [Armatimonadota bacterium]
MTERSRTDVDAVVLAAGASRRLGRPKQLEDIGGKAVIAHVVDNIVESGACRRIAVVLPPDPELALTIRKALAGRKLTFTENGCAESPMLHSIKLGIAALPTPLYGIMVALGDQPLVLPATILALCRRPRRDGVVIPRLNGRSGHPIVIGTFILHDVLAIPAASSLKEFIDSRRSLVRYISVPDIGTVMDVDTQRDLDAVRDVYRVRMELRWADG